MTFSRMFYPRCLGLLVTWKGVVHILWCFNFLVADCFDSTELNSNECHSIEEKRFTYLHIQQLMRWREFCQPWRKIIIIKKTTTAVFPFQNQGDKGLPNPDTSINIIGEKKDVNNTLASDRGSLFAFCPLSWPEWNESSSFLDLFIPEGCQDVKLTLI